MEEETVQKLPGKLLIPSLALAFFGTSMLDVLASLFLVDLAKTFLGSSSLPSIAIVSQIVTLSSAAAITFGVLNGFLSVKVNHKTLLLFGAFCIVVGVTGSLLAPNLLFLAIFYPFDGIGTIIVSAMAFTLIGETLPFEQRAKSVGIVTAAGIFSTALGYAIAGWIATFESWRAYLSWYVLPISLVALAFAFLAVPFRYVQQVQTEKQSFSRSFKEVLLNRSAAACLLGSMLLTAGGMWSFFAATFWKKNFLLSTPTVAAITVAVVSVYALGGFVGGRVVDKVGRKRMTVCTWFARGVLIALIVFMPDVLTALLMSFVATLVGGFAVTAGHCLSLEQAPKSRGTMMSMGGVFGSIGVSVGIAVGGLTLGMSGFQLMGLLLGLLGVASSMAVLFFARDPILAP